MLEGLAEAIPLSDCAVDAVTVADGFHWFRPEPAEIRRVLEPGGGRVLLSTIPDWSGASWADGVGAMMERLRPEHPGEPITRPDAVLNERLRKPRSEGVGGPPAGAVGGHEEVRGELVEGGAGRPDDRFECPPAEVEAPRTAWTRSSQVSFRT